MSTRDNLSQLSEEELEQLYQEKKADYEQKMSKNRRIRGILSRKINEKQKAVDDLKKEIDDFIASHPELSVAKENFYHIQSFILIILLCWTPTIWTKFCIS